MPSAEEVIKLLNLEPLDCEGGFFRRSFGCEVKTTDNHDAGSCIYYLLRRQDRSKWHKLKSAEIWFFHDGATLEQRIIYPDGRFEKVLLGRNLLNHERPQNIILPDCLQTSRIQPGSKEDWALLSTAVFPGFEYEDFTGYEDEEIARMYPAITDLG